MEAGNATITLKEHYDALDRERKQWEVERRILEDRFLAERDRRYTEVSQEREKALKIKEEADKTALGLQRDNQIYKDEKANELREQIGSERGLYATHAELGSAIERIEAQLKPIASYVSVQQGRGAGLNAGWGYLVGLIVVVNIIIGIVLALLR